MKLRTSIRSRAIGALGLTAALLVSVGCAERAVTPAATPANSGQTSGLTNAVHLRYRVIISSAGVGASYYRRLSRETGTAQIWARGAHDGHSGAVREDLVVLPRGRGTGQCI